MELELEEEGKIRSNALLDWEMSWRTSREEENQSINPHYERRQVLSPQRNPC